MLDLLHLSWWWRHAWVTMVLPSGRECSGFLLCNFALCFSFAGSAPCDPNTNLGCAIKVSAVFAHELKVTSSPAHTDATSRLTTLPVLSCLAVTARRDTFSCNTIVSFFGANTLSCNTIVSVWCSCRCGVGAATASTCGPPAAHADAAKHPLPFAPVTAYHRASGLKVQNYSTNLMALHRRMHGQTEIAY